MHQDIQVRVVHGDAMDHAADVLVVKHAQIIFGLDRAVAERYSDRGGDPRHFILAPGEIDFFPALESVRAPHILAVGVKPHYQLGYPDIREFGRATVKALSERAPETKHFVTTVHGLHGSVYYLDEAEAVTAQIAGYVDALVARSAPKQLSTITIVEFIEARAKRIAERVQEMFPDGLINGSAIQKSGYRITNGGGAESRTDVQSKPSVFVAMPFHSDFEDIFEYGILNAVHHYDYICERADKAVFTGDVLEWVKQRIRCADLVIADLTGANPNVYLEIGFAWGANVATLLVVRDTEQLRFDTQGQRCIEYTRIKQLNQFLLDELPQLIRARGCNA
jgi:hypothetical protein